MIEVQNLIKSFDGIEVIKEISSIFEKGKTNLVIGASVTGKSVILKCLVGLLKPDKGNVLFNDRDFTNGSKKLITEIRREIGMLFQGGALFDSKNVEDNVMFPLNILSKLKKAEKIERVNHWLKHVGLDNINDKMT